MKITVYLPTGIGTFDVHDTMLVYNGTDFVPASEAKFIGLYSVPVAALSLAYKNVIDMLLAAQSLKALVKEYDAVPVPVTDPLVIVEPNPSATCICGITCNGLHLSYVKVTQEPV